MLDFWEKTYKGVNALSALSVVKMIIGSMSSPFNRVVLSRFEE